MTDPKELGKQLEKLVQQGMEAIRTADANMAQQVSQAADNLQQQVNQAKKDVDKCQ